MKPYQHLLVCLGEEGGEVAKECSKCLRFGLHDQVTLDPNGPRGAEGPTNVQKIVAELNDLLAVASMLVAEGVLPENWQCSQRQTAKIQKVAAYMHYAKRIGTLQDAPKDEPRL